MPVVPSKSSPAREALKENAAKLKEEVEEKAVAVKKEQALVSSEVRDLFKAHAQTGMENVSGSSLPYLKITEANSTDNLLPNGEQAPVGTFYYVPSKEAYASMRVVFLLVSRGFYSAQENKKTGETDIKFQQLLGGMNLDTMEPFAMFASGTRWKPMMDFMKTLSVYTKDKENPLPMFSLPVQLTLEKIKTDFGLNHIVKYELYTDEDGKPTPITEIEQLNLFISGIEKFTESFESFITNTEVDKRTGKPKQVQAEVVLAGGETPSYPSDTTPRQEDQDIAEEIPF